MRRTSAATTRGAAAKRGGSSRGAGSRGGGSVASKATATKRAPGNRDFGIPADEATRRARRGEDLAGQQREHRAARSGSENVPRDAGVGAPDDGPGSHSGGDVSNDFTGVGTGGGVAESGAGGHTRGPASSTGSSDEFASGPHARGDNTEARATSVHGTTHDARPEPDDRADEGNRGDETDDDREILAD